MGEAMGVVASRISRMRIRPLCNGGRARPMAVEGQCSSKEAQPMAPRARRTWIAVSVVLAAALAAAQDTPPLAPARVAAVRAYIKSGWTTLSRSTRDLAKAAPDPKFRRAAGQRWPVYLPPSEDRPRVE